MYILGAPPSKYTSKKKSNNFEIHCMLYCYSFSAVKACSFEWLADGKSMIKKKLNRLINSVCFRVQSITKKEKHGVLHCENTQWNVKCMVHESTQWIAKYIIHESYLENRKFLDAKINWLTWWYSSRLHVTALWTFHIVKDDIYFLPYCFRTFISAISPCGIHARHVGEKLRGNSLWIILIWFCETNWPTLYSPVLCML